LQQAVDAVAAHGSVSAASRFLNIPVATLRDRYKEGIRQGLTPENQALLVGDSAAAPAGYMLKGTSTYYNKDGEAVGQWVKTSADQEKRRLLQEASFRALAETLTPLPKIESRAWVDNDLLNLYTLTDCHVGMLAWDRETGADWDLKIAEQCLVNTFVQMIKSSPQAGDCIVNQLGDFLHFDSLQPMTPTNHHILDADSRYQKMVEVAVRILRIVVSAALSKHRKVRVLMNEGNHDPAGSVWLRILFAQLYASNPRVVVEMSPNPYGAFVHGKTMLGFHHGHLSKTTALPLLFASKFAREWGDTEYRYIHTGHRHHVEEKEHPGATTVQHPTLAAPDAYAARGGWLSKRQATSITYHKQSGEFARNIFIPNC
jgi:hypothetical protein